MAMSELRIDFTFECVRVRASSSFSSRVHSGRGELSSIRNPQSAFRNPC